MFVLSSAFNMSSFLCFFMVVNLCELFQARLVDSTYVGILLDPKWDEKELDLNSFTGEMKPLVLPTSRKGFRQLFDENCKTLIREKAVGLIGPGIGTIGGIGSQLAESLSIPFIGCSGSSLTVQSHGINMLPQSATRAEAVVGLASEMGHPCIVAFSSNKASLAISSLRKNAQERVISFKLFDLVSGRSPESEIFQISKEILSINKSGSCVVVLDCVLSMAKLIFQASSSFGIPTSTFVWVLFREEYMTNEALDTAFPVGVLGIRKAYKWPDLVYDAIMLFNQTFEREWLRVGGASGRTCEQPGSPWIDRKSFHTKMIQENVTGKTGPVRFNINGERTSTIYEIVKTVRNSSGLIEWERVGKAMNTEVRLDSKFWTKTFDTSNTSNFIRMVTTPEDPLVIVSKDNVAENEECVLSHLCVRYKRTKDPVKNTTKVEVVRSCCIGYVIDVLTLLEMDLGVTAELYFVEDGLYGAFDPETKTWNGMINELVQGKADMALTTLTILEARQRVVDFSNAFLYGETKLMLHYSKDKQMDDIEFGFLNPFDTNLWLVLLATVNVILLIVWSLDHYSPYGHYKTGYARLRFLFDVPACMSYIYSTVFKLQLDNVTPRSNSARAVSAVFSFGTLILASTYTANLAASLVNTDEFLAVKSIHDKKFTDPNTNFKFATLLSSSTEMLFSRSTDPAFKRVYENMKKHQVKSFPEAVRKLRNGELDVFIDDSPFLDLTASKQPDCSFRIVGRPISMQGYGVAFQKGSRWTQPISQLMLKYDRRDFFRKITQKWFAGVCKESQTSAAKAEAMDIKQFTGLFYFCLGASLICAILLVVEFILHKFRRRKLVKYRIDKVHTAMGFPTRESFVLKNGHLTLSNLARVQFTDENSIHSQETQETASL
ncbi:glutamate [NMDA] receptor subunit 1 [Nematostella vectensis]|uniref:glutamate [NMDA] receptor subunit 1 n=1 Tax=Nematostella vectensis TaxID=45351 RepID=UPI0020777D6B|nr:glutamate [NMDA] receptor subunit 1 [Nematostella vectensis]